MLRKLKEVHKNMAILQVMGYSPKEIAERYDRNPDAIYRVLNDPLVRKYKAKWEKVRNDKLIEHNVNAVKIIEEGLPSAAEKMIELAKNAKSESVQEKACKDILYMGGLKPTDVIEEKYEVPNLYVRIPGYEPDEPEQDILDNPEDDLAI